MTAFARKSAAVFPSIVAFQPGYQVSDQTRNAGESISTSTVTVRPDTLRTSGALSDTALRGIGLPGSDPAFAVFSITAVRSGSKSFWFRIFHASFRWVAQRISETNHARGRLWWFRQRIASPSVAIRSKRGV